MFDRRQVMLGSLAGLIAPAAALAQGGPGGAPPPPPPNAGGNVEQLPQINPTDAGQNMMLEPVVEQPPRIHALALSQSYQRTPALALANTTRDAALMARSFQRLHFDHVAVHGDGSASETLARIAAYLATIDTNTIALAYFAGHGVEIGGENLLLLEDGVTFLSLQALVQMLQRRAGVTILFLDACRNNPFQSTPPGALVSRAVTRGQDGGVALETVSVEELRARPGGRAGRLRPFALAGSGIRIVFSTDPANVALDAARPTSRNGPFAEALARRIRERVSLDDIVSLTTGDVLRETRRAQSPWSQGSIDRPIFLSGRRRRQQGRFREAL